MKIALDYDRTYTLDPKFWNLFVLMAQNEGHDVRIVTARDSRYDRIPGMSDDPFSDGLKVIYTRGIAKRWFLTHFGDGFVPDIWIDDRPESILENSDATPEALARWRETREE